MQTTLMLPDDLLAAVDDAVREGRASSRDELIGEAIRRWFASVDGEAIDLAFASMSDDVEYLAEAEEIAWEFARAEWDAFRSGEQRYAGDADASR